MSCAIICMKCTGAEVCGLHSLANDVGFPNPGSLRVRKDDGYDMASFL